MINSPIEEIKNKLDIVEVIGGYIKLEKAGINFRAPCPFHSEKNPSFFVSPSRQLWHCFGSCSEGGDIFKFVMKIEGVEFGDALRILAQKAGIQLKKIDPKLVTERQRLYEICDMSCSFFEKQLEAGQVGKKAKEYLLNRGISEKSIETWRIGYAPETWQGLSDFLVGKGYKRQEIEKSGLAIKKDAVKWYDRFRARIMFPIFDLSGQVVGFTGRTFGKEGDGQGKYVNTPSTLLYDKSRILYGLDKAKMEIRKKDACILVEGQTDVILSCQAGLKNVAATSGTALTLYQLGLLKRYSNNLITAFDMDTAGDSATKRGIDLAQAQGFNIKVAIMPEGKDPADVVSQNPKEWEGLIKKALSILDFYFKTTFSKFDCQTPEGKKGISNILLPIIKRIPNRIEQSHWIQELAGKLGVKEEDIDIEMKKIQEDKPQTIPINREVQGKPSKTRKEILEEKIISLILKRPQDLSLIEEKFLSFFSSQTKEILSILKQIPNFNFQDKALLEKFPSHLTDFLNELCLMAELEQEEEPKKEIQICLREIQNLEVKKRLDQISLAIKKAEQENNKEQVETLTQEFNKLTQELI
ncbi:DNA primase [Candidatus Parcubacteria bacterium]|nr:DNA primase [Candidatus Parcubacteria bacterium]